MTDREKLFNLLYDVQANGVKRSYVEVVGGVMLREVPNGEIADHLIANGVTFATDTNDGCKWISVKDGLPEKEQDVLCSRGNHIGALMDVYTYMGDDKWDDTYGNRSCAEDEGITHWQHLPQPPKGE